MGTKTYWQCSIYRSTTLDYRYLGMIYRALTSRSHFRIFIIWDTDWIISDQKVCLLMCLMSKMGICASLSICKPSVNSPFPLVTQMCVNKFSTLIQLMACRLFRAKTLSEPMLAYCQLDHIKVIHRMTMDAVNFDRSSTTYINTHVRHA